MAKKINKKAKDNIENNVEDKYYYEPWHPSMNKPMTLEQKKLVEARNKRFWDYIMSKQPKTRKKVSARKAERKDR